MVSSDNMWCELRSIHDPNIGFTPVVLASCKHLVARDLDDLGWSKTNKQTTVTSCIQDTYVFALRHFSLQPMSSGLLSSFKIWIVSDTSIFLATETNIIFM